MQATHGGGTLAREVELMISWVLALGRSAPWRFRSSARMTIVVVLLIAALLMGTEGMENPRVKANGAASSGVSIIHQNYRPGQRGRLAVKLRHLSVPGLLSRRKWSASGKAENGVYFSPRMLPSRRWWRSSTNVCQISIRCRGPAVYMFNNI